MSQQRKLKLLKMIGIFTFVPFLLSLIFYLGVIVPEYLACDKNMFEGEKGISIWNDQINCDGESMAISVAFFQLFSLINILFVMILVALFLWYRKIKSSTGY